MEEGLYIHSGKLCNNKKKLTTDKTFKMNVYQIH